MNESEKNQHGSDAPAPETDRAPEDAETPSAQDDSESQDGPEMFFAAIRELGPFVTGIVVLCVVAPAIARFGVMAHGGWVKDQFSQMGERGPWLYGLLFALLTGAALMPTYALSGVAGFAFGPQVGSVVAVAGVVGGAMIGYVLAQILARRRVMGAIENHPKASVIREALVERGLWTELGVVTLLRLPPNSPFALTNLVMSSTRVNPISFLVGTAVGMSPRTILAALIGATIASGAETISKEEMAEAGRSILGIDLRIIGIGLTLAVLIVIYVLFSRWSKAALRRRFGESAA